MKEVVVLLMLLLNWLQIDVPVNKMLFWLVFNIILNRYNPSESNFKKLFQPSSFSEISQIKSTNFQGNFANPIYTPNSPGVFLWILRNFNNTFFYRTPLGDCFCPVTLREKFPNTELFLVRIFLYSVLYTGKYRPEITPYLDTFHAV